MKFTKNERKDRPGSIEVRWFIDGQKQRKSFPSNEAADNFIRDQKTLTRIGATPMDVIEAQRVAAGTGIPLPVLARKGLEQIRATNSTGMNVALTFRQAAQKVIDTAIKSGARQRTIDGYEAMYSVLNLRWGDRVAAALGEQEVEDYLRALPNRRGLEGRATAATRDGYLRHIKMALRQAGVGDPLKGIVIQGLHEGEVEFFTISEVRQMLEACPVNARGFLAVALFAGIRPENLEALPENAISAVDKRIRIPADIAKDGNTHLLESGRDGVLPDTLWKWLRKFPYQRVNWTPLQRRLARRLGRWVQDGLRHTGATYYCAIHGVSKTARLLTHAGESLVRKHYAGVAESVEARRFYELTPDTITFAKPTGIQWPTDMKLAEMLRESPATQVALAIGCSDVALTKRCRDRGIEKPGRGEWTKREYSRLSA